MKKTLALLLSLATCLSLVACGGTDTSETTTSTTTDNDNTLGVEVEESFFTVDVTMPSTFFTDTTEEEIQETAQEKGFSDCVINADGSVTYTMSKSKHEEMLQELQSNLDTSIQGMLEGEDAVASFEAIDYEDDFSKIDIYVNDNYSAWDSLYTIMFYMSGAYYQAFSGVESDNIDIIVTFIDSQSDEILNTASYRDYMENMSGEPTESKATSDTVATSGVPLTVGETITVDDECEFYLDYTDITDDVMPPSPGKWYTHYEAEDGKTYIDVCIAYKNLYTKDKDADEILSGTLIYAGSYQYTGFSIIEEDNRGDFTYSNITSIAPLDLEYVHYLFEVPEVVETSDCSLTVNLNIAGTQYDIVVREGENGEGDTLNSSAVSKSSGSVKEGDVIAIMNTCEFQIDYSNITDDVMPLIPGSWYTHYEADDGKVYVDFCVAYKNWKSKSVDADEVLSATLTYAEKYEYNGFSMIEEDGRSDFTYANITKIAPLSTEYVHYLFEVPEEVESSGDAIEIAFTIGGNSYSYQMR